MKRFVLTLLSGPCTCMGVISLFFLRAKMIALHPNHLISFIPLSVMVIALAVSVVGLILATRYALLNNAAWRDLDTSCLTGVVVGIFLSIAALIQP